MGKKELTWAEDKNGCHVCTSHTRDTGGYPQFCRSDFDGGKTRKIHRYVWYKNFGPIPLGMCICHKCDNPACININHLFIGTKGDNNRDCENKGRRPHVGQKGEEHSQAKLTYRKVLLIRSLLSNKTQREISLMFGVSQTTISHIAIGRSWIA